jgi:hydrogenase-4 component F
MLILVLAFLILGILSRFINIKYTFFIQPVISFFALILALILTKYVLQYKVLFELNKLLFMDSLNALLVIIISALSFLVSIYSIGYFKSEITHGLKTDKVKDYYFWMNMFIFAMLLLSISNNLGILWIAIEGTTLATTFLISFYNNKEAVEAGWKYIIICSVGIAFAFFGIVLLYFASSSFLGESFYALNWTDMIKVAAGFNKHLLDIAFIFILVGFGTKVGFAPFHFWLPDAHSEAPSPVSALMSGVLLNCALYAILRVYALLNIAQQSYFADSLLMFFGLFSVLIAAVFIIKQRDYKRLLAYSSMEHMGIITFAFSINSNLGILAGLLGMLNHAFTKTLMFFSAGSVLTNYHTKRFSDIKGLFNLMPITAGFMILGVFAITGNPPFGIFISEFLTILSSFRSNYIYEGIALLLLLVFIFIGFIYSFVGMLAGKPVFEKKKESYYMLTPMLLILIVILSFGFYIPDNFKILAANVILIIR